MCPWVKTLDPQIAPEGRPVGVNGPPALIDGGTFWVWMG